MRIKKGFSTIEVLVAMLIIMLATFLVTVTIQRSNAAGRQNDDYSRAYVTLLSLKDRFQDSICERQKSGKRNGLSYRIECRQMASKILKSKKRMTLQYVRVELSRGNFNKSFEFLNTVVR